MVEHFDRITVQKLGVIIVYIVTCFVPTSEGYNCSLDNGHAVPYRIDLMTGTVIYTFMCNDGFQLVGQEQAMCRLPMKPFCQYEKCAKAAYNPCEDSGCDTRVGYYDSCLCSHRRVQWTCTQDGWTSGCRKLDKLPFATNKYSGRPFGSYYPVKTFVTTMCLRSIQTFYRKCTVNGWSGDMTTSCGCTKLQNPRRGFIHYYPPTDVDSYYVLGTWAIYTCSADTIESVKRRCTEDGWSGMALPDCRIFLRTTTPQITEPRTKGTPRQHNEERTLVIVSGTAGAILGTLIMLVVIVTCQRRLHYHRMRRARLRCRQDQDAFAAYITYHRDVRFMLPSYDEAVNQQEHGEPPTFDEAVATIERPRPSDESPPDASILVPIGSEGVGMGSSDVSQALVSPSAEGRFFRAVRMLFGGRSFTPRAIYCHLVPDVNEEERDGQSQPSRPETAASELETGHNNEGQDVEVSGEDQATRDLNELLIRAGLC